MKRDMHPAVAIGAILVWLYGLNVLITGRL